MNNTLSTELDLNKPVVMCLARLSSCSLLHLSIYDHVWYFFTLDSNTLLRRGKAVAEVSRDRNSRTRNNPVKSYFKYQTVQRAINELKKLLRKWKIKQVERLVDNMHVGNLNVEHIGVFVRMLNMC